MYRTDPHSRRVIALVLLMAGTVSGCARWSREVEPPIVSLVAIEWTEPGAFEQRFRIDLRVQNPNPFELEVEGLDFQLDLNGTRLTRGLSGEPFTLAQLGESHVSVTATTTLMDMVRQFTRGEDKLAMHWVLYGRVFLSSSRELPFASSGQLGH